MFFPELKATMETLEARGEAFPAISQLPGQERPRGSAGSSIGSPKTRGGMKMKRFLSVAAMVLAVVWFARVATADEKPLLFGHSPELLLEAHSIVPLQDTQLGLNLGARVKEFKTTEWLGQYLDSPYPMWTEIASEYFFDAGGRIAEYTWTEHTPSTGTWWQRKSWFFWIESERVLRVSSLKTYREQKNPSVWVYVYKLDPDGKIEYIDEYDDLNLSRVERILISYDTHSRVSRLAFLVGALGDHEPQFEKKPTWERSFFYSKDNRRISVTHGGRVERLDPTYGTLHQKQVRDRLHREFFLTVGGRLSKINYHDSFSTKRSRKIYAEEWIRNGRETKFVNYSTGGRMTYFSYPTEDERGNWLRRFGFRKNKQGNGTRLVVESEVRIITYYE